MLLGRESEMKYLNECYNRHGSQIVVVYGQNNIGKATLLKAFMNEKPSCYYFARSCSEKEQLFQWSREINDMTDAKYSYEELLTTLFPPSREKRVLVIEEFQNLIRGDNDFVKKASLFFKNHTNSPALLVLSSSSVDWVENSMVKKLGETAFSLSGLLKIKEMHFIDMQKIYADFSQQQCLETYAILGGVPGLWDQFEYTVSIKENVIRHILQNGSFLSAEAERILSAELRETNVYNTILVCLAAGMYKLNDLYKHTGFSRAKISVYLKNLMELEIVEKSNERAGTYRIRNQYLNFYFTFIYPNMSFLQTYSPQQFFETFISMRFNEYIASYWDNFHYSNFMQTDK